MKIFPRLINAILAHTGESRATLCKRTGISKTSLNDFLGGRKDLSFDAVIALVAAFPRYNVRWLLTGVKSQAMIDHQKKLDAAKKPLVSAESIAVMKAVEAEPVAPSDEVVTMRFNIFCAVNGLRIKNEGNSACTIGGDVHNDYTYISSLSNESALMGLIKKYSCKKIEFSDHDKIITAPDFFQPI